VPVAPALRELRQEDHKLEASLGYIVRHCLNLLSLQKQDKTNKQTKTRKGLGAYKKTTRFRTEQRWEWNCVGWKVMEMMDRRLMLITGPLTP
jgi:hypothetical protein